MITVILDLLVKLMKKSKTKNLMNYQRLMMSTTMSTGMMIRMMKWPRIIADRLLEETQWEM